MCIVPISDILCCGACELIFFNLDDFVAHKSEDCQASKVKSSSDDSDVEVIRHSPSKKNFFFFLYCLC